MLALGNPCMHPRTPSPARAAGDGAGPRPTRSRPCIAPWRRRPWCAPPPRNRGGWWPEGSATGPGDAVLFHLVVEGDAADAEGLRRPAAAVVVLLQRPLDDEPLVLVPVLRQGAVPCRRRGRRGRDARR